MERIWPPQPHRFPVAFKLGNETTGVLKSVSARPSSYYEGRLQEARRRGGTFFETDHCFNFDCSFYFPHQVTGSPSRTVNNVLIMLNGLNEIHNVHFAHYDRIGAALAFRGLGVVLYPTPFHLNRTPYLVAGRRNEYESRDDCAQNWPRAPGTKDMKRHPSVDLMKDQTPLFACFDQTAREVIEFAKTLKRRQKHEGAIDATFYDHYIAPDAQISLLGYSMGGLQALYTFLLEPKLFHQCVLVNSGVAITELNPKPVGISLRNWRDMARNAKSRFNSSRLPFLDRGLLQDVLFGFKTHSDLFNEAASRLLFISGGADPVANPRYLSRLVSDQGLNLMQIAGLAHPLESPVFDWWFFLIVNAIHHFLTAPSADNLSAEAIVVALRHFRIDGLRWDKWLLRGQQPQESVYINRADQNLLLEEFFERFQAQAESFLRLYVMSKRYFGNDAELLRAMERL